MSSILDTFGTGKGESRSLALGSISRIDGDDVYVTVESFNRSHDFGPILFEHVADATVGDAVLVGFDEQGTPWIASWAGLATGGGSGTDPDAVHTGDAAGGVLSGTYPDPGFAVDMATQAELNAEAVTRAADDATEATARATVASNLATHAGLTTSAHGGIVASTDPRLTDSRTPTAHASTHASAGSDPVTLAQSQITSLVSDLALKSPLASPTFTGTPAAPTAAVNTNTTQIATTEFVLAQASASGDGTPAMDGTAARGTSTHFARADHVHPTDTSLAPLASPTFTGDPKAPTPSAADNDTSIATTAFVQSLLGGVPAITIGTTPPSSPTDGDLWYYTGSGFTWAFIYDSSEATYKWKFVGGPPMFAEVTTDDTTTSATYAALTTAGPSIALPRAGDYMVEIGFAGYVSSAGSTLTMSYDIGGTGAVDADGVAFDEPSASGYAETQSRPRVKTGLTAVSLVSKYKRVAGTAHFLNRWMRVTPVRVI
jgi:hypothetical protein